MHSSSLDRLNDDEINDKQPVRQSTESVQSTNPWIIGGPIGSKDSILVFRTCALTKTELDDEPHPSSSSSSSSPKQQKTAKDIDSGANSSGNCGKVLEQQNQNTAKVKMRKKVDTFKGLKKRTHDSLSSSETSISSACDDPTEVEDDILKASQKLEQENSENISIPSSVVSEASTEQLTATTSKNLANELNKVVDETMNEKENVTEDLIDTCDMPAALLKITYKFTNTETKLLRRIVSSHGLKEAEDSQNFSLLWTGIHIKPDILRNLTPYQRVNHFPRSYELTRKDRLYKNIEKMQHLRGIKHFDIVPLSFMLPHEYRDLQSAHRSGQRGPWIVKPVASSRGRGIFIVNSPEQISSDEQVLVSKYIADPLCIDGHKCDVRLYVAVTSFDPLLIYMYEEGLVRLATVKYDKNVESLWNPCMHLCNYSINKYHSDYIKATDSCEDVGHKWTFSALLRHLKNQGCDINELMINIEEVIVKSIFACSQSIVSACRMFVPNGNNCFELYGFDILIDDTLKPWLLEVNLSPSLGIDTPLDAKVKASLMTDLLTLIGIPALTPLTRAAYDTKWSRFKANTGNRKTVSSEHLSQYKKSNMLTNLTSEELRIVRNARAQYARRGGFVRIYPTEDSPQKYGNFLDPVTGIPVSTTSISGSGSTMIIPHNYNQMLYHQLYNDKCKVIESNLCDRMDQYERALDINPINLNGKNSVRKCVDEARRLRKQIRKLIENGNELSHLQARKTFSQYLECILKRLTQEPKNQHEKMILKFITRSSVSIKPPSFIKNPYTQKIFGKDRSAMVAKLLGDYLESYNRETDTFIDTYDRYGRISTKLFNEFLAQAQEADLESVLTLHTNVTQTMPFLYNRSLVVGVPATPPIPTGANGFLKALPSMAPQNVCTKDVAKIDTYYRSLNTTVDRELEELEKKATTERKSDKLLSSTKMCSSGSSSNSSTQQQQPLKKRSISQTAVTNR